MAGGGNAACFFFIPVTFMNTKLSLALLCLTVVIISCKSDYEKMLEREQSLGGRQDSLFLGTFLQMTRDSFYRHCLVLNERGVITNGPYNNTALYLIPDSDPRIDFNFYPKFRDNKIVRFDATFSFPAWAPWNKETHAEALLPHALKILEKWYGSGFIDVSKDNKRVWVKVNRNRRIRVFIKDEQFVHIEIKDLTAPDPED